MAKGEAQMQPIEVYKIATERLQTWSLAVARMEIDQILGNNFQKNKPVEYERLQNLIANVLENGRIVNG